LSIKNPLRTRDMGVNKGSWADTIERAKAKGHDGIVYRNEIEDKGKDSWIAFSPTQIKSVRNRGAWSSSSADITKGYDPSEPRDEHGRWTASGMAPEALEAVKNTPGAQVSPDGIDLDVARWQDPDQAGEESIRTGVFFTPELKSPYAHHYHG